MFADSGLLEAIVSFLSIVFELVNGEILFSFAIGELELSTLYSFAILSFIEAILLVELYLLSILTNRYADVKIIKAPPMYDAIFTDFLIEFNLPLNIYL